jgi:type IV fimbrial biogenesis protein FimT
MKRTAPPSGFTLIELLLALAVLSILAALALPVVGNATSAANASQATAAVLESVTLAVRRASIEGVHTVACPGDANGCRSSIDWSNGWIVFADNNGDHILQPGERILHTQAKLANGVHLRSTAGRTRLVFQANGGNAGSNVTFTLCDKRGAARATTLVLANDGRLRNGTPTEDAAQACMTAM